MSLADDLRNEADKQTAIAQRHLTTLDPTKELDSHLLGLLAATKAAILFQSASLHEAIDKMQMTKTERAMSRVSRLRIAAIRNDEAAMRQIEQEIIDEHERNRQPKDSRDDPGTG